MDASFEIADLIIKSIKHELTASEQKMLDQWLAESEDNLALYDRLLSNQPILDRVELYQRSNQGTSLEKVLAQTKEAKVVTMPLRRYLRYAASILLPLIIAAGLVYYFMKPESNQLAGIDQKFIPGVQRATLTLADGNTVSLDNTATPKRIQQGKATLESQDATLVYSVVYDEEKPDSTEMYNELTTPYGGRYQVTLSDGSMITLNAGSSLRYPVRFSDSVRMVYLSGEAYFDVSHTGSPFLVNNTDQKIRVLGTTFNVTAYANEPSIITTLVDGKVQVEAGKESRILVPGDQSVLDKSNETLTVEGVNTTQYTAWINGKFEFSKADMEVVMRRLSRWYDFEYSFENAEAKAFHFTGRVDNSRSISSILQMLEATSEIQVELKENTIIIK